MSGKFIVIEGLEGAGKSTACHEIITLLYQYGIKNVIYTREPGGTPIAEQLRTLIQQKEMLKEEITDYAELLMLYAARIQLVDNIIKPALERGSWVVGDRHDLSSQAYQGGGRKIKPDFINHLKEELLGDFSPDLTLYLDITPEISLQRTQKRGALDRIEIESLGFFTRTRNRYLALALKDKRIQIIDATQQQNKVTSQLHKKINQWLQESYKF
ncbi:Thymidylate kinase [Candidatus Erwinia haradaeae]|uniref:Thymidylate kinase n=1 Tax=Candidatus Erwinia haradaeae TaxID=1922217 RepID=A0A451CZJ3_9GAMM|nr:dTMP kinase [Candidatus Erwinia haradaeae]VFP78801.1 Thymidylate kinase [Candidatus Erwinia haradaeae]